MNKRFIIETLEISEKQVEEGKVLDAFESLQLLKEKYNLNDNEKIIGNTIAKKG